MKVVILFFYLATILFASNNEYPKPFSKVGDVVYANAPKIEALKEIKRYSVFKSKIQTHINTVKNVKKIGFELEKTKKESLKTEYLRKLRALHEENNFFQRTLRSDLVKAIKDNDVALFETAMHSGLINFQKQKFIIMKFFKQHKDDVSLYGDALEFIQKNMGTGYKVMRKTKKQLAQEKIIRLRETDALEKKKLEQELAEELKKKKEEIRQEQEKELFN